MGEILIKTVFLPKVCHIELKYAFLLFWSIFGENHGELVFIIQKVILRIELRNTQKFGFS